MTSWLHACSQAGVACTHARMLEHILFPMHRESWPGLFVVPPSATVVSCLKDVCWCVPELVLALGFSRHQHSSMSHDPSSTIRIHTRMLTGIVLHACATYATTYIMHYMHEAFNMIPTAGPATAAQSAG